MYPSSTKCTQKWVHFMFFVFINLSLKKVEVYPKSRGVTETPLSIGNDTCMLGMCVYRYNILHRPLGLCDPPRFWVHFIDFRG